MEHPCDSPAAAASTERQFVSFELAGEKLAVPMGPVQEIIRLPEVARLPLAPHALLGLANLRGRVLPLMSLRRLLGLPDTHQCDAERALVIHCGQTLGFLVDKVCSVLEIEPDQLEPGGALGRFNQADLLQGLIRRPGPQGQDELLMVLDFERLVQQAFALTQQSVRAGATGSTALGHDLPATPEGTATGLDTELRLVSFTVSSQEYGIPIEDVQEIVQLPETISELPQAPSHMRGVVTLRQRLLPLVDLRSLFGLGRLAHDEHQRVVVVSLPGCGPVGLVTDAVKEVIGIPRSLSTAMPELLTRDGQLAEFESICRLDDGKRLISVLSAQRLLGLEPLREAAEVTQQLAAAQAGALSGPASAAMLPREGSPMTPSTAPLSDDLQLVIFRLGAEEFGVPIMCVQEIVRVPPQLTRVPRTPDFVEGVINLRGAVLPVIDQRARLGLDSAERNDRQRIMVLAQGDTRTGFIVDSVAEVLRVPQQCLAAAPALCDAQSRMIRQVARLQDGQRLVMLIDPEQLLNWQQEQRPALGSLEASAPVEAAALPLARAA